MIPLDKRGGGVGAERERAEALDRGTALSCFEAEPPGEGGPRLGALCLLITILARTDAFSSNR